LTRFSKVVAITAVASVFILPAAAEAAPATGSVTVSAGGKGKAAKALRLAGAKVSGVKGARGKGRITLPVRDLSLGPSATAALGGALAFSSKGSSIRLRSLQLSASGSSAAITALSGKKRIAVFSATGPVALGDANLSLAGASLRLTRAGARAVRRALELDRLPAGRFGALDVSAALSATTPPDDPDDPLTDPYADVCNLAVASRTPGSLPGPADPPALSSPVSVTGGSVDWRFKNSFSQYVIGAGGTIVPLAPATMEPDPVPPGPPPAPLFRFPASGEYAPNSADDGSDDQAVIHGSGEIVFCHQPHGFRVTLSNPTITIDGDDSRITVDVDTNHSGVHTPSQRIDLAKLEVSNGPFENGSGTTVTWSDVPVSLTAAGASALGLCNPMNPGPCEYGEGSALAPLTVSAATGAERPWGHTASCPLNPGSSATTSDMPPVPAAPARAPALASALAVSSGTVNWGLRRALRGTVANGGTFSYAGGATGTSANADADLGDAGDYFTWPGGTGYYEASATPGDPGRLVLRANGTVGICQGLVFGDYSVVLSNPEVVLDGGDSRLSFHVATRLGLSWTSGRVDIAEIEIDDDDVVVSTTPGPGPSEQTITWTIPDPGADDAVGGGDDDNDSANSNVKLATGGTSALWLVGNGNPASPYRTAGSPLNALVVTAVVPAP
jgi:hypothetical protein